MSLSDLLKEDRIRKITPDKKQALDCLAASERDIKVAKKLMKEDLDWAFSVAYNAALQAIRANMFAKGFCTIGDEHHKTIIQYAEAKFGDTLKETIGLFGRLRKKRHHVVYSGIGTISEFEAKKALEFAELILSRVKEKLR